MKSILTIPVISLISLSPALAQSDAPAAASAAKPSPPGDSTEMGTVVVYGESEESATVQNPFLPPVDGTRVFEGKRATVIDLDALPKVQANNYRQALALTPGLLVAEETTPLVSLGYRGIGDPHRGQFMQILKDGIPLHADPFGYPEAYFTPPLDTVDRMEFIRGGGSLMYGTQPAGALNYITHMPGKEPFSFRTHNTYGTDNLFSSYTAIDGTVGQIGYLGYYNHRQSDGFRQANSDYVIDGGHAKFVYSFNEDTRLIVGLDLYHEEHGEPGGLTAAQYAADRNQTIRFDDRMQVTRNALTAELQHTIEPGMEFDLKVWGAYMNRWSRREILATSETNLERQEFTSFGVEPRFRNDWQAWGNDHTFTAGAQFYTLDSPRTDRRGASPTSNTGTLRSRSQRDVKYGSVFAENKFGFGALSITPGFRVEMLDQEVSSTTFSDGTNQYDKDSSIVQPLFGLGLAYDLKNKTSFYGNASQGYRGPVFTEMLIPSPGATVSGDIDPATSWTYEIGYRGQPTSYFSFDTSLFLVDLDSRFGVIDNNLQSVGRSINRGVDLSAQLDLLGAWDAAHDTKSDSSNGSLSLYGNVTFLDASLHGGPNDGGTPQYAPDYMVRTGLIYSLKDRLKVSMLGTIMGDHNAQDSGNPDFAIPSYVTWDLTAEVKLTDHVSLSAGINNLFNETYYSRVRSDGIDPAYERNFYIGCNISF